MGDGVSLLTRWANFYVITGTAAATLTGLQFVVISLGAERSRGMQRRTAPSGRRPSFTLALCCLLQRS